MKLLLALLVIVAVILLGCIAPPPNPSPTPTATPSSTSTPIGLPCGGVVGIPCPPGYECVVTDTDVTDAYGTCQPVASPTPTPIFCGGIAGIECPAGYQCVIDHPEIADAAGYCQPRNDLQAKCEGSNGTWQGGVGPWACDCGDVFVYNETSGYCQRCPEGQVVGSGGLSGPRCYTPSGFAGRPCDKRTDCGSGYCFLVNARASTGKGICSDSPFGCNVWIDDDGNFDEQQRLCVD